MGDKIDPDTRAKVEAAVARVRDALSKDNLEEIKSGTEALTQVWHDAASKMYSAASGRTSGAGGASSAGAPPKDEAGGENKDDKGGGAVDADFEVVE